MSSIAEACFREVTAKNSFKLVLLTLILSLSIMATIFDKILSVSEVEKSSTALIAELASMDNFDVNVTVIHIQILTLYRILR
jgi:hypothetical protein